MLPLLQKHRPRTYLKKINDDLFLDLDPFDHVQRQVWWYGWYEKKYLRTWEQMLQHSDLVVDIGASFGYYSLISAQKCSRVIAFEPDSESFARLTSHIAKNGIPNLKAYQLAVGNENQTVSFFPSGPDNRGMSGLARADESTHPAVEVPMVRLDDWLIVAAVGRIHMIKMDIEGAELGALQGMEAILRKWQPILFIEISATLLSRFGHTPASVFSFLRDLGYEAYQVKAAGKLIRTETPFEDELVVFMHPANKR